MAINQAETKHLEIDVCMALSLCTVCILNMPVGREQQ